MLSIPCIPCIKGSIQCIEGRVLVSKLERREVEKEKGEEEKDEMI